MKTKYYLILIIALTITSYPAMAHFDNSWDWHNVTVNGTSQYKTTVHYCFDASVNDTWKGWIGTAIKNWNDAGTGWTFAAGPPCQLTIKLEDIRVQSGGAYVSGYGTTDADGRISNLTMVFDSNVTDQLWGGTPPDGWGTSGNNSLDPVVVAGHELGHAIRMRHSGAGVDTGDLEDPVTPGNHNGTVSASDKSEAHKGTVTRGARVRHSNFNGTGGDIRFDKTAIIFREGSLYMPADIFIRPLSHMSTPNPVNIAAGTDAGVDAIIVAAQIRSDPPLEGLEIPATFTISYDADDLAGAYFVGDMQITPLGVVDESSIKALSYNQQTEQWDIIADAVLDADAKTVTFDATHLGFFGLGASVLGIDIGISDSLVIAGIVVELTHSEDIGLSTVVVEDTSGDKHTVTIPISEGKKMIVGDEVEITVVSADAEEVTIGDILEGKITGIKNIVQAGVPGITMVTVMGVDGMEYVIAVPFGEGALLSVGDTIKVPVTDADDGGLAGEGVMDDGGNPIAGTDGGDGVEGDVDDTGTVAEPTEIKGTVTNIGHSSSMGTSTITVQDAKGDEHEITVPLAEGEKIRVGVKVNVRIIKSADGSIESIDVTEDSKATPAFGVVMATGILSMAALVYRKRDL